MEKPESELVMAKHGEDICHAQHQEGFLCTRAETHRGEHAAHDVQGVVVKRWRGGRSRWAHRALPSPTPSKA